MVSNRNLCKKIFILATTLTVFVLVYVGSIQKIISSSDDDLVIRLKGPLEANNPELISYIKRKVIIPPSTLEYNLTTDAMEKWAGKSLTWPFINKILEKIFGNHSGGFFVEAGALNGEFLSNTLRLEQELGWTGLLVEPEFSNYKELLTKHRKAWSTNSCLSNTLFPQQVTMVSTRFRPFSQLLVHPMAARGSSYQIDYEKILLRNKGMENLYDNLDHSYYQVQCYPLFSFLLALNVTVVDFLSLDIQGSEEDVFETLPLDKIFIRSVVLERVSFLKYDAELVKRMNQRGFSLIEVHVSGADYFFINTKDASLMKIGHQITESV